MPDIRLLDNIAIRSKQGYAYLGNIYELRKLYKNQINLERLCADYYQRHKIIVSNSIVNLENGIKILEDDIQEIKKMVVSSNNNNANSKYSNDVKTQKLTQMTNRIKYLQMDFQDLQEKAMIFRNNVQKHDVKSVLKKLGKYWKSCVHYAQANNQTKTVQWLKRHGAST